MSELCRQEERENESMNHRGHRGHFEVQIYPKKPIMGKKWEVGISYSSTEWWMMESLKEVPETATSNEVGLVLETRLG